MQDSHRILIHFSSAISIGAQHEDVVKEREIRSNRNNITLKGGVSSSLILLFYLIPGRNLLR
jgi:hypothetical protein